MTKVDVRRSGSARRPSDHAFGGDGFHLCATLPTRPQLAWLRRGIDAPGGKLPLFDAAGREVSRRVIEGAIASGWAEPWFTNPIKPDWIVCRLTASGRAVVARLTRG